MQQSSSVKFNPLITVDSATLTGSFMGVAKFTYAPRILKIVNDSDVDITLSFDNGTITHDFIKAGSFCLYDFGTNRSQSSICLEQPIGPALMISGTAGTGNIYIVSAGVANLPSAYPAVS